MTKTDEFIRKHLGASEEYLFYDGKVSIRYDLEAHKYFRIADDIVDIPSVTQVCHVIDKSNVLIPWACKMMAERILADVPTFVGPAPFDDTGKVVGDRDEYEKRVELSYDAFEKLILNSKSAHRVKLEAAADIGHQAHSWIESFIKCKLGIIELSDPWPVNALVRNCCEAAASWMYKHNVRWICTERKIYSQEHDYAGTLDGVALVDSCGDPACCRVSFKDVKSLIDWKSSNYLYTEYLLQSAAYVHAYEEETGEKIDHRWIIRLGKEDGKFDPWHLTDYYLEDWAAFKSALDLTRSIEALKVRMDLKKFDKKERRKSKKTK